MYPTYLRLTLWFINKTYSTLRHNQISKWEMLIIWCMYGRWAQENRDSWKIVIYI